MIYFTEIRHAKVLDESGAVAGRVTDLALIPADDTRRIAQFVMRSRKGRFVVDRSAVTSVGQDALRISGKAGDLRKFEQRDDQLLISKDLLDQQIIDINGRKVVRVNDVVLNDYRHNGSVEVRVAEVDVGVSGAFRRLFEGILPGRVMRRLETALAHKIIPWEFVDLIETDPQRRVKLKISHDKLARLHPADLADIVEELAPAEREAIFETLDESKAADALSEVEPKVQKSIIEGLDSERAADILEEMAPDEAADLLAELPEKTSEGILDDMQPAEAEEIEELLEFEENAAGGMMNTDFIAVAESGSVDDAMRALRAERDIAAISHAVFLTDKQGRLTGAVPIVELLLAAPSTPLLSVKPELLLFTHADNSERDVISMFDKYNLYTLPVIDLDYNLIGVITADDIISRLKSKL